MIELVAMVYRSPAFLNFIAKQLNASGYPWRIVGNDAEEEVISAASGMPFDIYEDPDPEDHYLSRVYRCWNYCVESSKQEAVCLLNSDMAVSPGWIGPLKARYEKHELPVSRLVEPGTTHLRPGKHAIEIDLGRDPERFPWEAWRLMARDLAEPRVEPGGLFMPCILNRKAFLNVGGYPEGNVRLDQQTISGDAYLFGKLADWTHVTCFDSLVYHFQEGEMNP